MSEDVHYQGIIREVKTKDVESYAKRRLREFGIKKDAFYGSNLECLLDECYEEFVEVYGDLYRIESKENIPAYEGFYEAEKAGENRIKYNVKYYNGGCGFQEALESAIDNMERK